MSLESVRAALAALSPSDLDTLTLVSGDHQHTPLAVGQWIAYAVNWSVGAATLTSDT